MVADIAHKEVNKEARLTGTRSFAVSGHSMYEAAVHQDNTP
jgi:hypothetical protein